MTPPMTAARGRGPDWLPDPGNRTRLGLTAGAFLLPGPPRPGTRRAFHYPKEACMFEERPQQELDSLLKGNPDFRRLYDQHRDLDRKVVNAELGVTPIDDLTLSQMKREKLAMKDRLARMYETGLQ
jgi:uncharacterized protein YdcH (DUF465 family)